MFLNQLPSSLSSTSRMLWLLFQSYYFKVVQVNFSASENPYRRKISHPSRKTNWLKKPSCRLVVLTLSASQAQEFYSCQPHTPAQPCL